MMREKILLDTDIGSDIDDAICLAYLLAQPRCQLMGVTTVSGEAAKRARLVSALCRAAGQDIPIYPGTEQPLLIHQRQPHVPQAAMLDRWQHDTDFPAYGAVEFMRQTIRANPGEITLLAIGPMTNVALLFAVDPEVPKLLKRLVMMVGVFTTQLPDSGYREWNAMCDPHAIAMIYRTPVQVHRSIGLDVTRQVTMQADEVRARFQKGLLKPVLDFAEVWFKEREVITFHDPLAATTIFDPDICPFMRGRVDVELSSPRLMGLTHWTQKDDGEHEITLEVDAARFFSHYFSYFE
jgi:inosine-uridine nucleoside N-ribohydrolase